MIAPLFPNDYNDDDDWEQQLDCEDEIVEDLNDDDCYIGPKGDPRECPAAGTDYCDWHCPFLDVFPEIND
jgi:hypothetical protein